MGRIFITFINHPAQQHHTDHENDRDHAADVYPGSRRPDRDLERFKGNPAPGSGDHLYHDGLCYGCDRENGTGSDASERKYGSTENGEAGSIKVISGG